MQLVVASASGDWGQTEPGKSESVMNQRLKLIAAAGTANDQ